jgi:hypothetical protein
MSAMDDANVPMGGAVADAAAAAATDTPLMPAEGETGPSTSPYASGSKSTSSSIVAAVSRRRLRSECGLPFVFKTRGAPTTNDDPRHLTHSCVRYIYTTQNIYCW